jgi:hypothetical protein
MAWGRFDESVPAVNFGLNCKIVVFANDIFRLC